MADNVTRLKQLLFDNEAEALADLSRKLDLLHQDRVEANRRFDAVFKRTGTDERLQSSVANILDGAFRDAEVANHDQLVDAVAPAVVSTIKTEIHNSRHDIAEALYPMTGRMVKAYISSSLRELTESINRRLEQNPMMLRMRAVTTGQSASDLLLAESQYIELDELFLIRRGVGELVARWPADDAGHNQDQVMSGILTAINDFASEALKDEGSSLRKIDLGDRLIYLRASPTYLLAAKCTGLGSAAVEKVLDDAFLSAIEQIHALSEREELDNGPETKAKLLALLAGDLQEDLLDAQEQAAAAALEPRGSPLSGLMWLIGIPLALWMCWLVYENYWRARVTDVANQIVISSSELKGYPTSVEVSAMGREVSVSGLAPTRDTRASLVKRLQVALPGTVVDANGLAVMPTGDHVADQIDALREEVGKLQPDIVTLRSGIAAVEGRIALATVRSNLSQAHRSIHLLMAELPQLEADVGEGNESALVARLKESASVADQKLKTYLAQAHDANADLATLNGISNEVAALQGELRRRAGEMSSLLINPNRVQQDLAAAVPRDQGMVGTTHVLAADSDHLATVTVAVAQLAALKKRLPKPPPPPKPYELSPRQKLEAFTRRSAIFFGTEADYRNERHATRVLDELATLMSRSKASIRVVGYTDEKGTTDQNVPLSQRRAEKVTAALVRRGVPRQRLVVLGRRDFRDISSELGARSPNRRVEFEVSFDNEVSR